MTEKSKKATRIPVKDICMIGMFTAIITVFSWISIPATVPFTLQTMAIFIAVGLLGVWRGTASVGIYILLGLIGVPVFSQFKSGPAALFGVTGGYIIGFIFMALVMGAITSKFGTTAVSLAIAMTVGLAVCYAFGTAWFVILYTQKTGPMGVGTALMNCVVPYLIPDVIKIAVSVVIVNRVKKYINI